MATCHQMYCVTVLSSVYATRTWLASVSLFRDSNDPYWISIGYPIVNDPLYNHVVFGPEKGKDGNIGKTDEELIHDLISIHNAENWLGGEGDDFAPNFFSAVIPPEGANAATPVSSSSDSISVPSGVSSRSQTPDVAAATAGSKEASMAVSPTVSALDATSEMTSINDEANVVRLDGNSTSTGRLLSPTPEATLSTESPALPVETKPQSQGEAIGNSAGDQLQTAEGKIATTASSTDEATAKPSQDNGNSTESASTKVDDGKPINDIIKNIFLIIVLLFY